MTSALPTRSSNWNSRAIRAVLAITWGGSAAWMRCESLNGMPTSAVMMRAISSTRAVSPSAML